ncbi:MAG: exopolysaccharide Pel transporter PelG [Firmicutes bacterium]|nr:exopolysaccharide Pel transporter PelG [Bacillota bacterium]
MAGIGFELKKLMGKGNIVNMLAGTTYAIMVTIGPTILLTGTLMLMYVILPYSQAAFADREFLSATILYVFIFSMIVTSPLNSVLSRYVADKIYQERLTDIMPAIHVGLVINIVGASLLSMIIVFREIQVGIDPLFIFMSYWFFMVINMSLYLMTYVSALKDYGKISMAYFIGILAALVYAIVNVYIFHNAVSYSILGSLVLAFSIIATMLYSNLKSYFRHSSNNYIESLKYFMRFKPLFITNFFYTLGLYIHNFVYWTTDYGVYIGNVFWTSPEYDMATCLALFTNISTLVIFVVKAETAFFSSYQAYLEAVNGGGGEDIEMAKKNMFRTLKSELFYIIRFQFVITIIIFILAMIFLPGFGFEGTVLSIYPALAAAYFVTFIMYCEIIFLFYFDDSIGTCMVSISFCAVTLIASIVTTHFDIVFAGLGLFCGAFVGWTIGYMRLRRVINKIDEQIFCRGSIISTTSAGRMSKKRIEEADEQLSYLKMSKEEKIRYEAEQQKQRMFAAQKEQKRDELRDIAKQSKKK